MNVVADALSRRPDYAEAVDVNAIDAMRSSKPTSSLLDDVKAAYAHDADAKLLLAYGTAPSDKFRQKLPKHLRARAHRFRVHDGLLLYNAVVDNADRVVVPNDHDLRLRIMYEYHDAPTAGHLGREKTYVLLTRDFYWHHQYKWVRKYIRACEAAYAHDADAKLLLAYGTAPSDKFRQKLPKHLRARAHRFRVHDGLLLYNAVVDNADRVVVPNDHDLRLRIMYEYHDAPTAGHLGREKTYVLLTRDFYWHHQYKWVRKYIRACEVCQRVKPAPFAQAPLQSLPTPSECWKSMSLDFIFGLPPDSGGNTGVVVFVDRFSKMVHLAAVPAEVTAKQTARLLVDMVFKHHGMPSDIVSDRDPRFTAHLWQEVFTLLGSQLSMSTADHPQTDGQTERVNRVLVDMLKSYAHSFQYWSECLSMAEFAINNSVHASTGHTPFYVNAMRHPRLPSLLGVMAPTLSGGGSTTAIQQPQKTADTCTVSAATMDKPHESAQGADSLTWPTTTGLRRAQTPQETTQRPGL
ncbi:reverse transcriptase [Phytophthora cinnamomi]|uniref:reverse transcriptase n=1 Tax=Phytophthora cinnamomi TaxID=4785 RepID=UPI00355A59D2|nr:reverse transcriptase [Phytophthora cinnamomi]